jgi:LPXTG-site transpeptidase (sortase) family protein
MPKKVVATKSKLKKLSNKPKSKRRSNSKNKLRSSGQNVILDRLPELLVVFGIAFMLFSGVHWYWRAQALTLGQEIVAGFEQDDRQVQAARPTRLFIKDLIDVGVSIGGYDSGTWALSATQSSYLAQSARPQENGNIVIYGHNKPAILGNLRRLKGGEQILLTTEDGQEHRYKVVEILEADPTETEYVEPTSYEVLTIYTCTGFMDRKRLIIRALPIKNYQ